MGVLKQKLVTEGSGIKSEPIAKGVINAVCVSALYIGIQAPFPLRPDHQFAAKVCKKTGNKAVEQLLFTFEVDEAVAEGPSAGKRKLVSKTYTFSTHENSGLTKLYKAWFVENDIPRELDTDMFVGKPALLTINDRGYIDVVGALPKGTKALAPEHTEEDVASIRWIQDTIAKQLQPEDLKVVQPGETDGKAG